MDAKTFRGLTPGAAVRIENTAGEVVEAQEVKGVWTVAIRWEVQEPVVNRYAATNFVVRECLDRSAA